MGMARQVWYADDVAAGGSLLQLKDWWSGLLSFGRHFGYHVNAAKTLNIWLQLSVSSMVQAFRLHLLGGLIWVQPSVPKTISEITRFSMGSRFVSAILDCCYSTSCCICDSYTWVLLEMEILFTN